MFSKEQNINSKLTVSRFLIPIGGFLLSGLLVVGLFTSPFAVALFGPDGEWGYFGEVVHYGPIIMFLCYLIFRDLAGCFIFDESPSESFGYGLIEFLSMGLLSFLLIYTFYF